MDPLPFKITGPWFLAIYAVFAIVVLIGLARAFRARMPVDADAPARLTDAYAVAILRGGPAEAVRVAMVSLTHRGHLALAGGRLATRPGGAGPVTHDIERAVAQHFNAASDDAPERVLRDPMVKQAVFALREDLVARGLVVLPGSPATNPKFAPSMLALALLVGVSWMRIVSTRPPHLFLIALTIMAGLVVLVLYGRRVTPAGRAALVHVQTLLGRSRARVDTLRGPEHAGEITLLAGAFGIGVFGSGAFPWFDHFKSQASSSSGSSGCGSDSGSGGDGGGGGCGGD